jgi:CRISPR-associated protein Cas1
MELVLNTYGVSLNRDNEGFIVSHKDGKQRLPVDGITNIQISKGAQITSDAVMLAIENEIEIVFVDKSGNPVGRVWSPKYGSISTIRKGQLNFTYTKDAVEWIKDIIIKKIENQQALLLMMHTNDFQIGEIRKKSIARLENYCIKVKGLQGELVSEIASTLRGWEGVSSKIYFDTLNMFIPEEYRFTMRSQHPATDVVNALLNYGYGLLYGKIEGVMIKSGIDPYI